MSSPPITYDVSELTVEDFVGYTPSVALAATALALYFLAAVVITWLTVRYAGWRSYMHTVGVTGLLEAGGYAAFIYIIEKSGETNIYGGYVIMQVFIILSPNLLQATDYVTLGKILGESGLSQKSRFLRGKVMSAIFIIADLVALCVQALGIALWASSQGSGTPDEQQIKTGSWITLGGLAFQLFAFLLFFILAVWTHRHPENQLRGTKGHAQLFSGLYLTIIFITIRNIFRFAEFTQNAVLSWPPPEGTYILSEKEVLFYTLDTVPILLAFAAFIIFHPNRLLFGRKKSVDATSPVGAEL